MLLEQTSLPAQVYKLQICRNTVELCYAHNSNIFFRSLVLFHESSHVSGSAEGVGVEGLECTVGNLVVGHDAAALDHEGRAKGRADLFTQG